MSKSFLKVRPELEPAPKILNPNPFPLQLRLWAGVSLCPSRSNIRRNSAGRPGVGSGSFRIRGSGTSVGT